jgi:hypothetical protein
MVMSTTSCLSLTFLGPRDLDGARRVAHDVLRHTAEEPAGYSGATMGAEDDQVGRPLFGSAKDLDARVAETNQGFDREAASLKLRTDAVDGLLGCFRERSGERFVSNRIHAQIGIDHRKWWMCHRDDPNGSAAWPRSSHERVNSSFSVLRTIGR